MNIDEKDYWNNLERNMSLKGYATIQLKVKTKVKLLRLIQEFEVGSYGDAVQELIDRYERSKDGVVVIVVIVVVI